MTGQHVYKPGAMLPAAELIRQAAFESSTPQPENTDAAVVWPEVDRDDEDAP